MRTTTTRLVLTLALASLGSLAAGPGCASGPPGRGVGGLFEGGWERGEERGHPALREGVLLVTWTRGRGPERQVRHSLRDAAGGDVAVGSTADLLAHVRPPAGEATAAPYVDLVRRLAPADAVEAGVTGTVLDGDPHARGPGSGGRYTSDDALGWGAATEPRTRPFAGGTEVTVVVYYPPVPHPLFRVGSPHRVVERREVVHPDGTVRGLEERTLTNGDDAARFAAF
jgi:hypothetical protein